MAQLLLRRDPVVTVEPALKQPTCAMDYAGAFGNKAMMNRESNIVKSQQVSEIEFHQVPVGTQ
eukprot:CAMPEP_0118700674 /NCGR_PEP_ID=MMETSP0800-20121206/16731_1 /TAXON_ID=210618 ORGANISM="Striatella unipunctata, Strain CCMP2910" /NCGR_SAMPLE_ID=MMETSP0800 /ASSEMBLY_ACC=CAM_ASM_000638 /LENGTH=62 /DNA_ID=CAMNT_0006601319 /DNA_START=205 /DNA_END=393 /DNA_ORIENTATION=-